MGAYALICGTPKRFFPIDRNAYRQSQTSR
jgi:hypothetical protein